jgi:hypothetical protein
VTHEAFMAGADGNGWKDCELPALLPVVEAQAELIMARLVPQVAGRIEARMGDLLALENRVRDANAATQAANDFEQ